VVGVCENSVSINCIEILDYPRILASQKGLRCKESNIL
jgi:hypothetical protein